MADTFDKSFDDTRCHEFESAWDRGAVPRIEDNLPTEDDPRFLGTLEKLVGIDLEHAWRRAQRDAAVSQDEKDATLVHPPRVEDYLERFSQLNVGEIVPRLVRQEFLVRHKFGDKPNPSEYKKRFSSYSISDELLRDITHIVDVSETHHDVPITVDRYQVQSEKGRGGFGVVWQAEDSKLGRKVAVKQLSQRSLQSSDARQRFLNEAKITARLEHPGIVPIHDLDSPENDPPFYTMKLVDGDTLARAIASFHEIPKSHGDRTVEHVRILNSFLSICRTMQYVHSQGVIHRDLKPQNVVLGEFGETIILDWGLAKDLTNDSDRQPNDPNTLQNEPLPKETMDGTIQGTPAYMSPEQAKGNVTDVDHRSDIYALGTILYQLLTGQVPFQATSAAEMLEQVRFYEPDRVRQVNPQVSRSLEAICEKAMAKDPHDRYQEAADLVLDIERHLADEPVSCLKESVFVRAGRWMRRHRTFVTGSAAAISVALIAAIGAIALLRSHNHALHESNVRETNAKNLAKDNLRRAEVVVDSYLTQVAEDPKLKARGLEVLRRDLLDLARNFYEEVLDEQSADPDLIARQADCYFRLGRLTALVESEQAAIADYRKSEEVYRKLVEQYPENDRFQLGQAQALNNIGISFLNTGKLDDAQTYFEKSYTIRNKLTRQSPGSDDYRLDLAQVKNNLGVVELDRGNPSKATKSFRESTEILKDLVERFPANEIYTDRLARYHYNLGRAFYASGETKTSKEHHEKALKIRIELSQQFTGYSEVESDVVFSYRALSVLAAERNALRESVDLLKKAHDLAQKIADERPDIDAYLMQLASVNAEMASRYLALNDLDHAIEFNDQALTTFKTILANGQRTAGALIGLAQAYNDRGYLRSRNNLVEGVLEDYLQCIKLGDELLKEFPAQCARSRVRSQVRLNLGYLYRGRKEYDEALKWFKSAVEAAEVGLAEHPDSPNFKSDAFDGHYWRGVICANLNRFVETIYFYDLAIAADDSRQNVAFRLERTAASFGIVTQAKSIESTGDHLTAASRAKQIATVDDTTGYLAFHAARYFDIAIGMLGTSDDETMLSKNYSESALKLLQKSRQLGYLSNSKQLKSETFQNLRKTAEFTGLLESLTKQRE